MLVFRSVHPRLKTENNKVRLIKHRSPSEVVVGAILGLAKRLLQLFFDGKSDVMNGVILI